MRVTYPDARALRCCKRRHTTPHRLQARSVRVSGGIRARRFVTNVVTPPRFSREFSAPCYKRRQSEPQIGFFWRFRPQIDDVCNMRGRRRVENAAD